MANLQWIKEGKKHLLKNESSTLVDLVIDIAGTSIFIINNQEYTIKRTGFWNPVFAVLLNGKELLRITHTFFGSNGKIIFAEGSIYTSIYKRKGGLKLRILEQENEILVYSMDDKKKSPVPIIQIGITMVDAEKLLILTALGMFIFSGFYGDETQDDVTNSMIATSISTIQ